MPSLPADIFGGTFDPVQQGHLEVIKKSLTSNRVLVVAPTPQNPWKLHPAAPLENRLEMLKLALNFEKIFFEEGTPQLGKVFICRYPYERSVELLRWWRNNFGQDIRWLVGPGDKESTGRWYKWAEEGCEVLEISSEYSFHSTDVREGNTQPHPAITEYIRSHNLYC